MSILRREDKVKLALNFGADLVVGIPFFSNIQAVNEFAMGSVAVAKKLKITHLAFGSEQPNFPYLTKADEYLQSSVSNNPEIKFKNENYANNLAFNFEKFSIFLKEANHLLGFYYALAAQKLNFPVELIPIKRAVEEVSSSKIRGLLKDNRIKEIEKMVPFETISFLSSKSISNFESTFAIVKAKLLLESEDELKDIFLLPEELLKRCKKIVKSSNDYENFIHALKTKRYTLTRIKRIYLYLLLGIRDKVDDNSTLLRVWVLIIKERNTYR